MELDKFQQAWQSQSSRTRVTVDANLLLKEVLRNQQAFQGTILGRDIGEIIVGLVLIPVWFFLGAMLSLPWSWYLTVPACIWVVGFILVDRMRHQQQPCGPDEPLIQSVRVSLADVNHQIWLLRNVFWWYLLPFYISLFAFFIHVGITSGSWLGAIFPGLFVTALYLGIYYLNQAAVRRQLVPRRQELLALLSSLQDEASGVEEGKGLFVMENTANVNRLAWSHAVSVFIFLTAITTVASVAAFFAGKAIAGYPKVSPFAAVRWQDSLPEVKVDGEWYKLVSIDDVPAREIVTFSQQTYGDLWRKRFEEDLVEVMAGMEHEPADTVRLVVIPLSSEDSKEQTLEDVPMTEANRRGLWKSIDERERDEQRSTTPSMVPSYDGPPRSSGPTGDALASLVTAERKAKNLVGLAAMVMVDGQVEAAAVHGERKLGSRVSLEIGDSWHLGGITKSITATMIARLVESGRMQWSDTIGEIFPEAAVHEDWKPVTLRQLLTDTAGAPRNFPQEVWHQRPALGAECTQARREAVLKMLAEKPAYPPGEKYAYSNVGTTIAAAMVEKATGTPWEDLVKREVFEPLELAKVGFGPPKSGDETLEQPRGHRALQTRKFSVDDTVDNTPIMGPSGMVHMSLEDLCLYAVEHLRGDLGEGKLLSPEIYKALHTPKLDQYACGWIRKEPDAKFSYAVYWHNGTNTMWYALVVFIPDTNMVIAVTSNDGDFENAEAAAWEIVRASIKQRNAGKNIDPNSSNSSEN